MPNLLVNYSNPSLTVSSNFVLLEQQEWDKNIGLLTKGGAVAYLNSLLYGDLEEDLEENCGGDESGNVNSVVYAYPSPSNLTHSVHATHGTLGPRIFERLNYSEVVKVNNSSQVTLTYPTENIISAEWVSKSYDRSMNIVPLPDLKINGGNLTTESGVSGLVFVVYEVIRYKYAVKVGQRVKDTENGYSSFIYSLWNGGNTVIKFNPPNDATLDGIVCGNRYGQLHMAPDDARVPPYADPVDVDYEKDYCSGTVTKKRG